MMNPSKTPSDMVVMQRIRNRLIEYLETASSYEAQREYEHNVPIADVPAEMFARWSDYVNDRVIAHFTEPVYSVGEQAAIKEFHAVWESVAKDTPNPIPSLVELFETEPWDRLRRGAIAALKVFKARGRFDEYVEAFPGSL